MDIEMTRVGPATVLVPKGELDMAAAEQVKRKLAELIDGGQTRLIMDLANVPFMDSSGLGALVAAMKHARAAGGDIKLCALTPDVRSIFDMTRLIKVMDVHPTRQDAASAWG